jgi:phosphatidylserine synthase
MSNIIPTLRVSAETTLESMLQAFIEAKSDIVLIDSNSVISIPHIELLTDHPRSASCVLVGKLPEVADTLVRDGIVLSASSETHTTTAANRVFTGAVRLSEGQLPQIKSVVEDALSKSVPGNPLDLLLVALVRSKMRLDAVELVGAPFARSSDPAVRDSAAKSIQELSLPNLRLQMANRANDGFFSVFVLRRLSKLLTAVAVKLRATPNQITILSFAIGLYAAFLFAQGDTFSLVAGALLLQLSLIVDCVDGEVARYTRKFSELGAWLDAITDRVKEYAVFLGLAYGAMVQSGQNLWVLAGLLMTIQTFRHLSDYNFSQVVKARQAEIEVIPIDYLAKWDGIEATSEEVPTNSYMARRIRYWLRKIVVFPIGERWLAISVTAALGGALFTFIALPILALISMFWVYRMRIIKSLAMPKTKISSPLIARQLDLGFSKAPSLTRFDWLEPSILRLLEMGLLIALFAATENLGVASFVVLLSIAFHHYDNLYRSIQNEQKPTWATLLGLTVVGRLALVSMFLVTGLQLSILAGYFLVLFLVVSPIQWIHSHAGPKKP